MPRVLDVPVVLAGATALLGIAAAIYYAQAGLVLSHYDAKAHLVVARRILDSLTPGWEQVGAVWLPLPHLVNMLPVQVDALYRTGLFAVMVSMACHALAAVSIATTVVSATASRSAAIAAAALFATNPNVLYLQSTPMTEPMLFGLSAWQVSLATRWVVRGDLTLPRALGWASVLACLTRYEAWPITAACITASAFAWWRRGKSIRALAPVFGRLLLFPIMAILGFMAFSRLTVGEWFVSGGFFVPDETLRGQPMAALSLIVEGARALGGDWLVGMAVVSALVTLLAGIGSPGRAPLLIGLSLFAAAALPVSAYLAGHPFRIRYEIALIVAAALAIGLAIGLLKRAAPALAVLATVLVVIDMPPFWSEAPMVREAQLDPNTPARKQVTDCLSAHYRGGPVMASMGSLGHYMHEMSASGFAIRDFLHEGNGPLWDSAFTRGPAALAEWVLVEEQAEGGDAIAQRSRRYPALLAAYARICEGGGVALYRRDAGPSTTSGSRP